MGGKKKKADLSTRPVNIHDRNVAVSELTHPVWEPQPRESFKAFKYFTLYRDMGAVRTIRLTAEEVGLSEHTLYDMSRKWRWQDRALAWEAHLEKAKTDEIEKASRSMASRQAKLGMMLQDKAVEALGGLVFDGDSPPTARDVVQLAEVGVKIERLARGEQVEEKASIIIQLPSVPAWAKTSQFVTLAAQDNRLPEPESEAINGE